MIENQNVFIYFGKQRGFTIKIKTWKKCCVIITKKNKSFNNFNSSLG